MLSVLRSKVRTAWVSGTGSCLIPINKQIKTFDFYLALKALTFYLALKALLIFKEADPSWVSELRSWNRPNASLPPIKCLSPHRHFASPLLSHSSSYMLR